MNQSIPANISQILLKRLFVFIGIFVVAMMLIQLHLSSVAASTHIYNTAGNSLDLNKGNLIFTLLNIE